MGSNRRSKRPARSLGNVEVARCAARPRRCARGRPNTCSVDTERANVFDYGFNSQELAAFYRGLSAVRTVPWGPRVGLHLRARARPASVNVRVSLTPKRILIPIREVTVDTITNIRIRDEETTLEPNART